ncbi:hypothetical protein HU200_000690 [Digitaria exilis]|uniref:NAC domain-containing protein n=1 Tax=Digitaria exilis TaxID=1010633 RepID=A0A835FYG3_9POAL|nr:hypothetical protein HU200_000690 [Digitaria exilis]
MESACLSLHGSSPPSPLDSQIKSDCSVEMMGDEEEEVNLMSTGEEGADGFDPTEDELMLHFLRPQLRGLPPRVAGAVLEEADPYGAPPWELLARHGLAERGHFFFAARGRRRQPGRRPVRLAGVGACSGVVVRWSRVKWCFYEKGGQQQQQRSTGWVMEEYEITDPGCYRRRDEEEDDDYWVLCRVTKRPAAATAKPPTASPVKAPWRKLAEREADPGVKAKASPPLRT